MCRAPSPQRGPLCTTRPGGISDYARRVGNVEDALIRGIRYHARAETIIKLGSDMTSIIDSLWPGFVQAMQIYAWSIGAGAVAFGIAGAVLGEGVGAVPGAMLGAKIGAEIATGILSLLGLAFLAGYVLSHLDEANGHFGIAVKLAWNACGDPPNLDHAAREFGRGIAALFSLLLEASVAWVVKRGLSAGLEELNKSKAGRALIPYAKVEYRRQKLGVTDAEVPRQGIMRTIEFFDDQTRKGMLNPMSERDLLGYWKDMDFSREVTPMTLRAGQELIAYRDATKPFGYYYTDRGIYQDRLGVDDVMDRALPKDVHGPPVRVPREFIRYRVIRNVEVLKSISSGVRSYDTKRPVSGGGTQYFIPQAWNVLEVVDEPKMPASRPVVPPKRPDSE